MSERIEEYTRSQAFQDNFMAGVAEGLASRRGYVQPAPDLVTSEPYIEPEDPYADDDIVVDAEIIDG
jgi:hypothetical protein